MLLARPSSYPVELLHVAQTGTIRSPFIDEDDAKFAPEKSIEIDRKNVMENPYAVIDKKTDAITDADIQLTTVSDDDQL